MKKKKRMMMMRVREWMKRKVEREKKKRIRRLMECVWEDGD